MTNPKPTNLDDLLKADYGDLFAPREVKTAPITLFGEEFEVVLGVQAMSQLNAFNPDDAYGMTRYLSKMIAEKDRVRFTRAMEDTPALVPVDESDEAAKRVVDLILAIISRVTEVASGSRPTASSSPSRTGTARRGGVKRSVVK